MTCDLPINASRSVLGCLLLAAFALQPSVLRAEQWEYPLSVAAHESGTWYVADRNLPGVWRVEGDQPAILFQGSKQFRTPLNAVRCVALDSDGKLLAGDSATRDVYRFDDAGQPQPLTAQGKPYGEIGIPMDITIDDEGNLYVSDLELHRIVKVPKAGGAVEEFARVQGPRGLFYDSQQRLWVLSARKLLRLAPDGTAETVVDEGVFEFPHTVVVTSDGIAYVCDGYAQAIWKIAPGEEPVKWVSGAPLVNPVGMDLHGDNLIVVDPHAKAAFLIDPAGTIQQHP